MRMTPNPTQDPAKFWKLREAPLHAMSDEDWQAYYPAMAVWLRDENATIRSDAVERLSMAVLRAENIRRSEPPAVHARHRLAWLLSELQTAHALHSDILPEFLRGLRYHGDHEPFQTPLLEWLDELAHHAPVGLDPGLIEGTRLLVAGANDSTLTARMPEWLRCLDHPSDYVRGCAAKQLGEYSDNDVDTAANRVALFEIIGAKEIERPGVAGPFWSPLHCFDGSNEAEPAALWMLDLLERRNGSAPADMPFNDIEFYLHELCSFSPEHMRRMLAGGFVELALMTATEVYERVEGVQPILEELAANANPQIAAHAKRHLAQYYA
jgi:hypothetical protein